MAVLVSKELVDNAVDAGGARVLVNLAVESNDYMRLTVTDNGCGMESIASCVEAFQSSKHQSTMAGRYGIGLTRE